MNTHKYIEVEWLCMQVNLHEETYRRGEKLKRPRESWSALFERLMDVYNDYVRETNDGR